jgi:NADPH-dependent glutamate synthase beta subunit-like oxidoreductase
VPATWRPCAPGLREAVRITRLDNPLPSILGRVCDHLCENTCIRTHLDQPLAIRQIKRFIMEQSRQPAPGGSTARAAWRSSGPDRPGWRRRVAGPAGSVTIFEDPYAGGMVGGAIPAACRRRDRPGPGRPRAPRRRDHYGVTAGVDFTLGRSARGFAAIFIAVGAQRAKTLGLPGEDALGVIDG